MKIASNENTRQSRRKVFEEYENSYELIQENIDELSFNYEFEDNRAKLCYDKFQALYEKFTQLNQAEISVIPQPQNDQLTVKQNISSLPRLTIPKFDGHIDHWTEFSSMFNALIHSNTSLTPVEKLQYLKSSLSGSALNTISNLDISNTNYEIAYKQLSDRYSNPRRLCSFYLLDYRSFLRRI